MRNIIKYKDLTNAFFGVWVTEIPPLPVPIERGERVVVAGRSGTLWVPEGAFEEFNLPIQIWVPPDVQDTIHNIRGWLSGEGNLYLDNKTDFYYKAHIEQSYEYLPFGQYEGYDATVPFTCYPFRYLRNPATIAVTAKNTNIHNGYTVYAEPVLTIYGSGDVSVTVGATTFEITDLPSGIVLDTENYEAYKGNVLYNHLMKGAFPVLQPGGNNITWTGNITKIEINPKWRSL